MKTNYSKFFFALFLASYFISTISAQTVDKQPMRLKVGIYNVGHFNEGNIGGYQGREPQLEVQRWRNWVGEQSLDILALCEWNSTFDKDKTIDAAKEILAPVYNNIYWGKENTWIYNGLATNYKLTNLRQIQWAGEYYALIGDLKIGEKIVTIISTHIPWQEQWHDQALADLTAELKKYEYVICMGDINALDAEQLKFEAEGFNIANGGYQGFFVTYPDGVAKGKKDGIHLDNIITSSNIKIMGIQAPANPLTMRDHYPIIANLIITW